MNDTHTYIHTYTHTYIIHHTSYIMHNTSYIIHHTHTIIHHTSHIMHINTRTYTRTHAHTHTHTNNTHIYFKPNIQRFLCTTRMYTSNSLTHILTYTHITHHTNTHITQTHTSGVRSRRSAYVSVCIQRDEWRGVHSMACSPCFSQTRYGRQTTCHQ